MSGTKNYTENRLVVAFQFSIYDLVMLAVQKEIFYIVEN